MTRTFIVLIISPTHTSTFTICSFWLIVSIIVATLWVSRNIWPLQKNKFQTAGIIHISAFANLYFLPSTEVRIVPINFSFGWARAPGSTFTLSLYSSSIIEGCLNSQSSREDTLCSCKNTSILYSWENLFNAFRRESC